MSDVPAKRAGRRAIAALVACCPGATALAADDGRTDPRYLGGIWDSERRIRLDAEHRKDIVPGYVGDSVGRWEGNTLVVSTKGFNGNFEVDAMAQPTSTELQTAAAGVK